MKYSASKNIFYNPGWESRYKASGKWPTDLVDVSDEVYSEFAGTPPAGKRRGADSDGMPCWASLPEPTPPTVSEQLTALTNEFVAKKKELRDEYAMACAEKTISEDDDPQVVSVKNRIAQCKQEYTDQVAKLMNGGE